MLLAEIFHKIYPVFLAGLVFGAGLPVLYAVAVRLMSGTATETADGAVKAEVHPLAKGGCLRYFRAVGTRYPYRYSVDRKRFSLRLHRF